MQPIQAGSWHPQKRKKLAQCKMRDKFFSICHCPLQLGSSVFFMPPNSITSNDSLVKQVCSPFVVVPGPYGEESSVDFFVWCRFRSRSVKSSSVSEGGATSNTGRACKEPRQRQPTSPPRPSLASVPRRATPTQLCTMELQPTGQRFQSICTVNLEFPVKTAS